MRLEINYKGEKQNTWRLNNILLTNQWITEKKIEEIKKYLETNEYKIWWAKTNGMWQKLV